MSEIKLVQVKPEEYGLSATEAAQVEAVFVPMLQKMVELENEFNEIVSMEIGPDSIALAKNLRLRYVKIRTGTADIHKKAKAYYLSGGRFVDAWKNAQLHASSGKEERLASIENYYENIEKERKIKLQAERSIEVAKYGVDASLIRLDEMDADVYENYLAGVKLQHENRLVAEKQAEIDRLKKEEDDRGLREENAKLQEELRKKEENEKFRKEEDDRKKKEQEEADQKAKAAPDKEKLLRFAMKLGDVSVPDMDTDAGKKIAEDIRLLMGKLIRFATDKAEAL